MMYLEHARIPALRIQSRLVVGLTIKLSYLVTREVGIDRVERADNVDGVQRHLDGELVAVKLTGSC